jgi:DNA polymerase-3 subunit alpha
VTDVVWNGVKPVFELKTLLGHCITATSNHPFRTLDGWTDLGDLRPGDHIAVPRLIEIAGDLVWPQHEIVTLAGLLAEGNTCHPSTLYFFGNDRVLVEDFRSAVACFPDTVARIHERKDGRLEVAANLGAGYAREGDDAGWGQASLHGNLAVVMEALPRRCGAFQWAQRLGIIGKKATEKVVPPDVFRLSDADLELFVGRLWAGDGFIANHALAMPYYATSSERLAKDVQQLLLRLGMVSGIQTKRFKYRGEIRLGYTVRVLGEDSAEIFLERIAPHALGRDTAVEFLRAHVRNTKRGLSCRDVIPRDVGVWVDRERRKRGLNWTELSQLTGIGVSTLQGGRGHGLRRATIQKLARFFASMPLERLATSDVFWDRVVSITPMGEQDTYDLTVEKDHNFVADGLIVHNSHSAAYALVAYQCAYLKAHYPAEFMAATMTSELSDTARIFTLIEESRRMGIEVRPPDVNTSDLRFSIEDGAIRIGLAAIRNVGEGAVEALIAAREADGAFKDVFDMAGRVAAGVFNRRVLESLICAGACDALGPRAAMFAAAGMALDHAASVQRERESGQSSLFGGTEDAGLTSAAPPLPQVPDWTGRERSAKEKEGLGFYLSDHPLMHIRDEVAAVATHTLAEALESDDGTEVRIVGIVSEKKQIMTKSGKLMGKVHLEDLSGRAECTLFSDAWEISKPLLEADAIVIGIGKVEKRGDFGPQILLNEVRGWERGAGSFRPILQIEMRAEELTEDRLRSIDEVLALYPGDSDVYLHIVRPDHSRLAMRSKRCRVAQAEGLLEGLKARVPSCRARWGKGGA